MDDNEWNKMVRFALDEPPSRFYLFMCRVAGYRFFEVNNPVCIPKYIIFERFKHYPHQLEQIEQGTHPLFRRVYKADFDTIQQEIWDSQSE